MKKKILFVMATIAAFALFVPNAMAEETTYVAQIGTEKYETLAAAIDDAVDGDTVELLSNVTLTTKIEVRNDITISGEYTITSTAQKIFEIYGGAGEDGITTVTIEDVTMVTSASNGRCVDTRSGDIDLTLDGATLKTTGGGNNQPITIGNTYADGESDNVITLTNTTVEAGNAGYCIIVFNPITLNITSSTLSGYAALYFKGAVSGALGSDRTVATVTDSIFSVVGNEGFTFGAVVFEDNNVTVNVEDTTISADVVEGSEFNAFQWSALNGEYDYSTDEEGNTIETAKAEISGNQVTVSGASEIVTTGEGSSQIAKTETENKVVIEVGVTSDIEIPTEYLPEGTEVEEDEDGNLVVVEKTAEELPPKTGDLNLVLLVGTIIVGLAGLVISSKKRFAKNN